MTYPFGRPGGLSWALNASSSARGATLFSGFEGVGLGMKAAGITHAWGIELEDDIAAVSRANGFDVLTADILQCDPKDFEQVNFLHASPPCPNFSNAKANGEETAADIALAEKVAEFIAVLLPTFFTLENVYQYRNSQSWETIARALLTHGYQFNYWHVNTADYGVPQTRKRMIVIARRDGIKPMLPPATHAENPVNGLFGKLGKWVGWDCASNDLFGELTRWEPTKRVTRLYPDVMPGLALINTKDTNLTSVPNIVFGSGLPAFSVTVNHGPTGIAVYKDGKHYSSTPKMQARFQSFPDCYELPKQKRLACKGIGNAVPPLFMQRLYEGLL